MFCKIILLQCITSLIMAIEDTSYWLDEAVMGKVQGTINSDLYQAANNDIHQSMSDAQGYQNCRC